MTKAIAGRAWPWPWVNVRSSPRRSRAGYEFMAENAAGRGHWDNSLAFAARDHDEGRKSGSLARVAWSQFCTAQGLHGKGELAGARATAHSALELCDQIGEFRLATWLAPVAATIAADQGDDDAARDLAQRGWERAQQLRQLLLSAWALNALGYAAMLRGDLARSACMVRAIRSARARYGKRRRAALDPAVRRRGLPPRRTGR